MSMKKNKSNKNTNIIEIIAEYIYLVIIGDKATLKNFAINLKKNINNNDINFIITRLDIPILFEYDNITQNTKKILKLDNSIESAQSYAYAQESFILTKEKKITNKKHNNKDNYMLMMIENDILRFPKIDLVEEDPEKMIMDWIKKYNGFVPDIMKHTIKPLSLVGLDDEILVYSAKL
jgi:hypothetical protein